MTISDEQLQSLARDTASSLQHVSSGRPFTPHLEVWKVREKVFLIVTENGPEAQIMTVKVDPDRGDALRGDVETISPGRYFNKRHRISIAPGAEITRQLIADLVHDSYDLASEIQRKKQRWVKRRRCLT